MQRLNDPGAEKSFDISRIKRLRFQINNSAKISKRNFRVKFNEICDFLKETFPVRIFKFAQKGWLKAAISRKKLFTR